MIAPHRRFRLRYLMTAPIVAAVAMFGVASPSRAAPQPESLVATVWALDSESLELTGTSESARLDFTVPRGWIPAGPAQLVLPYTMGPMAFGTVSVAVNDDYVGGAVVDSAGSALTFDIDESFIEPGNNTLRIVSDIDLTIDRDCKDPNHPARRIKFSKFASITVPLDDTGNLTLGDVPAALLPLGNVEPRLEVHLVGDDVGPLASAAAVVVSALEDDAPIEVDVTVSRHRADAFNISVLDPAYPAIIVGMSADVDVDPSDDGSPIASIRRSPTGLAVLTVGGETPNNVISNAVALVSSDVSSTETSEDDPEERSLSFEELGYGDRTLSGPGRDSTVYGFDVPISAVPNGATIFVDARGSSSVELGGVGVVVNGERIGVAPFDEFGRSGESGLRIPREVLRPGRNLVRIDADFDERSPSCSAPPPMQSIEISATTQVDLEAGLEVVDLDLDDLPYVFRDRLDSGSLTIVLPSDPTTEELAIALQLADLLGADDRPARIAEAEELDDAGLAESHLVVMGAPERQPLIRVFAAEPESDLDPFAITTVAMDGSVVDTPVADADPAPAVVRFATRTQATGRVVLVLSGLDDDGAALAYRSLIDVELRPLLDGGAASIDENNDGVFVTPLVGGIPLVLDSTVDEPASQQTVLVDEPIDITLSDSFPAEGLGPEGTTLPDGPPLTLTLGALGLSTLAGAGYVRYRRREN